MVITGAMAFTFHKAINPKYQIGNSLFDSDGASMVEAIMTKAKEKKVTIIIPDDFICNSEINGRKENNIYSVNKIPDNLIGIDIGKNSIAKIHEAIMNSKTIFLNGANGVFESESGKEIFQ